MAKIQNKLSDTKNADGLFKDISLRIEQSRKHIALVVNQEMTLLYWNIGRIISNVLLKNNRADYGKTIIATLSQQLAMAYGKGFTISNINRMINSIKHSMMNIKLRHCRNN